MSTKPQFQPAIFPSTAPKTKVGAAQTDAQTFPVTVIAAGDGQKEVNFCLPCRYRVPLLWVLKFLSQHSTTSIQKQQSYLRELVKSLFDDATETKPQFIHEWRHPRFEQFLPVLKRARHVLPSHLPTAYQYDTDVNFDWVAWAKKGLSGTSLTDSEVQNGLVADPSLSEKPILAPTNKTLKRKHSENDDIKPVTNSTTTNKRPRYTKTSISSVPGSVDSLRAEMFGPSLSYPSSLSHTTTNPYSSYLTNSILNIARGTNATSSSKTVNKTASTTPAATSTSLLASLPSLSTTLTSLQQSMREDKNETQRLLRDWREVRWVVSDLRKSVEALVSRRGDGEKGEEQLKTNGSGDQTETKSETKNFGGREGHPLQHLLRLPSPPPFVNADPPTDTESQVSASSMKGAPNETPRGDDSKLYLGFGPKGMRKSRMSSSSSMPNGKVTSRMTY